MSAASTSAATRVTRDEVIRREFRQFESSWYDASKIKLSRDRVDRLGYFKEVNVETPEVQGTTDQVDVNMNVVEKPTGNFALGGGFSQSEKFTLTGSIQQANAFGSGNTVGLDLNTSKRNRTIALSQTNPYFTDDGISRSYEALPSAPRGRRWSTSATTGPHAGRQRAFRRAVLGSRHRVLRRRRGAHRGRRRTRPARWSTASMQTTSATASTAHDHVLPAHGGVAARQPRQRIDPDDRPLPARQPRTVDAWATCSYYRAIYQHQYFKPFAHHDRRWR